MRKEALLTLPLMRALSKYAANLTLAALKVPEQLIDPVSSNNSSPYFQVTVLTWEILKVINTSF